MKFNLKGPLILAVASACLCGIVAAQNMPGNRSKISGCDAERRTLRQGCRG
jgi:hypothetical protein